MRAALALAAAVALGACSGGSERGGADALPGPVPSGVTFASPDPELPPSPDFRLRLLDGTEVTGASLWSERPVVLVFLASWCGACGKQQPSLTGLAERYGDRVAFLAVAGEDEPEELAGFLDEHEVPYAAGIDERLEMWRAYGVREPPHVVVVAKGGVVVKGWPGGVSAETLTETLDELIES